MIIIRPTDPWLSRVLDLALVAAFAAALLVLPAVCQAQAPAAAVPAQAAPARRAAWTSDGRTFQPGDGLTVLLDEYTLAAADRSNSARSSRSTDADLSVSQNVVSNPSIPRSAGAGIGAERTVESSERGASDVHSRFQGEITVRVVGVEGTRMKIEGKKRVQIDRGWQEIALTGWISPSDVLSGNVVESRRVGELQLVYTSRGGPRQGIISRVIGLVWP